MLATVIIPLYNKEPFIRRALSSVLGQSLSDFELIIVDDGSTDDGPAIVACCPDARVKLISQHNAGPGAARNRGIAAAQGEFIAFLDADDEWLPEYLLRAVAYLQHHADVGFITMGHACDGQGEAIDAQLDAMGIRGGQYRMIDKRIAVEHVDRLLDHLSPCTTVIRKSVLDRYSGFFDKWKCLFAEDLYLMLQLVFNETFAISREKLVILHPEASGLSHNLKGAYPIEPFLIDPSEILARCPAELRDMLEEILALRAARTARNRAEHGLSSDAKMLLDRFCHRFRSRHFWYAQLTIHLPTAVPFLRAGRRFLKNRAAVMLTRSAGRH